MKPQIDKTTFGSITVEGTAFSHDIIIRPDGQVKKRKKKLSKAAYGSSHTLSLDEAKHLYKKGTERLIIGSGQYGVTKLSDEAVEYLQQKNCLVELLPTPQAIESWNRSKGVVVGMFHITC